MWKPIETAPSEQWVLLLDARDHENGVKHWVARKLDCSSVALDSDNDWEGPYADGYLCSLDDVGVKPTHWMPLPEPLSAMAPPRGPQHLG